MKITDLVTCLGAIFIVMKKKNMKEIPSEFALVSRLPQKV